MWNQYVLHVREYQFSCVIPYFPLCQLIPCQKTNILRKNSKKKIPGKVLLAGQTIILLKVERVLMLFVHLVTLSRSLYPFPPIFHLSNLLLLMTWQTSLSVKKTKCTVHEWVHIMKNWETNKNKSPFRACHWIINEVYLLVISKLRRESTSYIMNIIDTHIFVCKQIICTLVWYIVGFSVVFCLHVFLGICRRKCRTVDIPSNWDPTALPQRGKSWVHNK